MHSMQELEETKKMENFALIILRLPGFQSPVQNSTLPLPVRAARARCQCVLAAHVVGTSLPCQARVQVVCAGLLAKRLV